MKLFKLALEKVPFAEIQLVAILAGFTPVAARAQGTLDLKNFGSLSVNAQVFLPDGVTPLSGGDFLVLLMAGPTPNSLAALHTTTFLTNGQAGYFDGGVQTIPTVPGGAAASVYLEFWRTKYFFLPPEFTLTNGGLWGASPFLSTVLGDQTPGVLAGLGTGPLVLAMPTLVIRQTNANTLAFSWNVLPGQYALFTGYVLQQTSDLTRPKWTSLTDFWGYVNGPVVLPVPAQSRFYRLLMQ